MIEYRVCRGGNWHHNPDPIFIAAARQRSTARNRVSYVGLRCLRLSELVDVRLRRGWLELNNDAKGLLAHTRIWGIPYHTYASLGLRIVRRNDARR